LLVEGGMKFSPEITLRQCRKMLVQAGDQLSEAEESAATGEQFETAVQIERLRLSLADVLTAIDYRLTTLAGRQA
jgi:hypothetical protein